MIFKALHISLENGLLGDEEVVKRILQTDEVFEYKNEVFLIEKKRIDNRYLWLYCQYENSKIYGEVVFNTRSDMILCQ